MSVYTGQNFNGSDYVPARDNPRLGGQLEDIFTHMGDGLRRVYIKFRGRSVPRARLAFYAMTGCWPSLVDHVNGKTLDDRWLNLREATPLENARNSAPRGDRVSGVRRLASGRYQARLRVYGRSVSAGTYGTRKAARAAYEEARRHFYGDFHGIR